jgi:hypothetical protein
MALPIKQLKAFAKGPKKGRRPEDEDDEKDDDEDEKKEEETASGAGEGDDDAGDDVGDAGDEGDDEEGDDVEESGDTFAISKLSADAEEIEKIVEEIDADLDGEECDEKAKAKVKGSLGRLPKGARKLIRGLKDKDFPEIEEIVDQLADDGTIKDSGRFASWLYCAAQDA